MGRSILVWSLWAAVVSAQPAVAPPASTCQGAQACERDCERGNAAACSRAGKALDSTPLRALGLYQRGCDGGDGSGCAALASMYRAGRGVQPDATRAYAYDNAACERRYGPSCLSMARAFEYGAATLSDSKRVAQEMERALPLYFKSCEAGVAQGCSEMARLYLWGVGTKSDPVGAAVLAQRGCDKGDPAGCSLLSHLYKVGWGVTIDLARTAEFARRAKGPREPAFSAPPVPRSVPATLELTSEPSGLLVSVDKMLVGRTPLSVVVPAGQRLVEATAEGLGTVSLSVKVEAKKQTPVVLAWPGTLRLEASVAGATATIDGQAPPLKLPWSGAVGPGAHAVLFEAPGFEALSRQVTVKSGAEVVERATLKALPGALQVESTPPGAAVKVDDTVVGVAPWSGPVSPGIHSLVVESPGFQPVRKSVTVAAGSTAVERIVLTTETAAAMLTSMPPGASLSVDGQALGVTPWSGRLAVGEHAVSLSLAGYGAVAESLQVVAGKTASRSWPLPPQPGTLTVESTPTGASVKLDGAVVGVTPWTGEVKAGSHSLAVELAGHQSVRRALTVKPGSSSTERVSLSVEAMAVSINTTPKGASLVVDGAPAGLTPWRGTLPAGVHAIDLSLEGYETLNESLQLASGAPVSRSFSLVPSPRAIAVSGEPTGAEVLVDGARVGILPWSGELALGTHLLVVQAPGYTALKKTLKLTPGPVLTEQVALKPELKAVRITSTPAGASVTVDGKKVGTTPWSGKLAVGSHVVEVLRAGLQPATDTLVLGAAAGPTTKDYPLAAEATQLKLTSVPPGADVLVDETRVGTTPWEGKVLPGAHAVVLRRAGHRDAASTITVDAGTTVARELKLEALTADITILTRPAGARLAVDGADAGISPLTVPLTAGPHRVTAALEGHRSAELPFDVEGAPRTLTLELAPDAPVVAVVAEASPPPAPPPDALTQQQAVLKDEKASLDAKQAALTALATNHKNLSEFVEEVVPVSMRDVLCVRWRDRVTPALVTVTSKDSFKDDQAATLLGAGEVELAQIPWEGPLPACLSTLSARTAGGLRLEREVKFKIGERNDVAFAFPGRPTRVALSAFGDLSLVPREVRAGEEFTYGGGVRLDYWGKLVHFSVGLKAHTLYAEYLTLPVIPAMDLFFGLGTGLGNGTARFYFSFDVGAFSVVTPTVRLSLALSLFDRFFITGGLMAHLHVLGLFPPPLRPGLFYVPFENFIFPGATLGVGFGW